MDNKLSTKTAKIKSLEYLYEYGMYVYVHMHMLPVHNMQFNIRMHRNTKC